MVRYTLQQLHDQLELVIARSQAGEEVVITADGRPVARIIPVCASAQTVGKRPPAGWGRGRIHLNSDFDAPLQEFGEYSG